MALHTQKKNRDSYVHLTTSDPILLQSRSQQYAHIIAFRKTFLWNIRNQFKVIVRIFHLE